MLPAGVENVEVLAHGDEATIEAAVIAAADALVGAAQVWGRQEYRLALAHTEMIIMPGLDDAGRVDLCALRDAVHAVRV